MSSALRNTKYRKLVTNQLKPTETAHGGTGYYLNDYIVYVERTDLHFSSVGDFETSFVEIKFPKKKNLVIGCIYRHQTSNIQDFNQYFIEQLLQIIYSENKQTMCPYERILLLVF